MAIFWLAVSYVPNPKIFGNCTVPLGATIAGGAPVKVRLKVTLEERPAGLGDEVSRPRVGVWLMVSEPGKLPEVVALMVTVLLLAFVMKSAGSSREGAFPIDQLALVSHWPSAPLVQLLVALGGGRLVLSVPLFTSVERN